MLTDTKVRNAKQTGKPYRVLDSGGLSLAVSAIGTKSWVSRTEAGGREKMVTLGRYPAMSLADARRARDALRAVPAGQAPCPTLSAAIKAWLADQEPLWKPRHATDVRTSLAAEIEPTLGAKRLTEITPSMLLDVLRPIQARGAVETAHRLRQRVSAVYGHAIAGGQEIADPAARLTPALKPVVRQGRRAALVDLDAVRAMLTACEAIPAHPVTKLALRLLGLTSVRPGELRGAIWDEIDGDLWTIPAARMKHTRARASATPDHLVPLSTQAQDALAALRRLTGRGRLLFPNPSAATKPLSENAIGYLMNRAGYHGRQTAHGWRATFSTLMNERYPADRAVIDLMLAHQPAGAVEAAYNRATHSARRRELAQAWADLLMEGAPLAEELTIGRRRSSPL